jgi:hypothetical protein
MSTRALAMLVGLGLGLTTGCKSDDPGHAELPDSASDAGATRETAEPVADMASGTDAGADQPSHAALEAGAADAVESDGASPADAAADKPSLDAPARPADAGGEAAPGSTRFEIRVPLDLVPADGQSLLPLLIHGVRADGSPALDEVILSVSRPGAGLVKPRVLRLGGGEPQSYFVPCSSAERADCVGTTRIRMELASAPGVVVAESPELSIAALDAVGSPGLCLLGGSSLFLDGSGYIFSGTTLFRGGVFDG